MKEVVVFKKAAASVLLYSLLFSFPFKLIAQSNQFSDSAKNAEFFQLIRSNNLKGLEETIVHGANMNATLNGFSALMAATLNGSLEAMKLLVDHGADLNYSDADGLTAIWYAIPNWDKTIFLIDHGADIHKRSKEGYELLVKIAYFP